MYSERFLIQEMCLLWAKTSRIVSSGIMKTSTAFLYRISWSAQLFSARNIIYNPTVKKLNIFLTK